MKKLLLSAAGALLLSLATSHESRAQGLPVIDVVVGTNSGIQTGLQATMKSLETKANVLLGNGIIQQTLTKVTSGDNLAQHKQWYESLQKISNAVRTYQKVNDIFKKQTQVIALYSNVIMTFRSSDQFTPLQLAGVVDTYTKLLGKTAADVADLGTLLKPASLKMTDAERMTFIDEIDARLTKHCQLVGYFTQQNMAYMQQAQQDKKDLLALQALLGK